MNKDLSYYRRRRSEEQAAEQSASHPAVREAHHELAREYDERIAALESDDGAAGLHAVNS